VTEYICPALSARHRLTAGNRPALNYKGGTGMNKHINDWWKIDWENLTEVDAIHLRQDWNEERKEMIDALETLFEWHRYLGYPDDYNQGMIKAHAVLKKAKGRNQ
jgi:hypothetical protein